MTTPEKKRGGRRETKVWGPENENPGPQHEQQQ